MNGFLDSYETCRKGKYELPQVAMLDRNLDFLLQLAPDPMLVVDTCGNIVSVNEQLEQLFNYRSDDLLGQPVEILIPPAARHEHAEKFAEFATAPSKRAMGERELQGWRKNGEAFFCEISLNPYQVGDSLFVVAAIRDVSARKKIEKRLSETERQAALGRTVAGVAHELNTPIGNAITVASALSEHTARFGADVAAGQVRRSTLDSFLSDMTEGMAILLRGLQRTAELVGHFKQIAVDQTSEQRRDFRLQEVVQDVVGIQRCHFEQGNVTLESNITSTTSLDSFPGPLGQVLVNLTANSRLHGFDAGMAGKVVIAARDLPGGDVEITVEDTGKGIPDKVVGHIFEPFFNTRLGQEGTGLGLSIVFNIVTGMLGGTVHVESTVGTGTRMIVRIPRTAPEKANDYWESTYDVDR